MSDNMIELTVRLKPLHPARGDTFSILSVLRPHLLYAKATEICPGLTLHRV